MKFGFTGNITYESRTAAMCVAMIPLNRILLETDGPHMCPDSMSVWLQEPSPSVDILDVSASAAVVETVFSGLATTAVNSVTNASVSTSTLSTPHTSSAAAAMVPAGAAVGRSKSDARENSRGREFDAAKADDISSGGRDKRHGRGGRGSDGGDSGGRGRGSGGSGSDGGGRDSGGRGSGSRGSDGGGRSSGGRGSGGRGGRGGRGSVCHSGHIPTIATAIAHIKGVSMRDVLLACRENTRQLYGI